MYPYLPKYIKLFVSLSSKIPCTSNIERVMFWKNCFNRLSPSIWSAWNSMFMWEKIKGSNGMNFFSTPWKTAKSFYLIHCRNSLSSTPGKLHTSILKDMLNQSLGSGDGEGIFLSFDHLHLASVTWWPSYYITKFMLLLFPLHICLSLFTWNTSCGIYYFDLNYFKN